MKISTTWRSQNSHRHKCSGAALNWRSLPIKIYLPLLTDTSIPSCLKLLLHWWLTPIICRCRRSVSPAPVGKPPKPRGLCVSRNHWAFFCLSPTALADAWTNTTTDDIGFLVWHTGPNCSSRCCRSGPPGLKVSAGVSGPSPHLPAGTQGD